LLKQRGGSEFDVLHLVCQGIEITLKALLLMKDFKRYQPKLRKRYGLDLMLLADDVLSAFDLHPLRRPLRAQLKALSSFYAQHLLRYGSMLDIFVNEDTIAIGCQCRCRKRQR
jgi:hypothetical protein